MTSNDADNKAQEELYTFIEDLEFVQCLANPSYLEYLALNDFFKEKEFLNYLNYLQYFKHVEYLKYITYNTYFYNISIINSYSRCLIFLDLLQYDFFRKELENPVFIQFLRDKIYSNWFENPPKEEALKSGNNNSTNVIMNNDNNDSNSNNMTSFEKDIHRMDIDS